MDLSILQAQHREWVKRNFPKDVGDVWPALAGMVEEMGELSHHILKRHQGIRGSYEHHSEEIKDAVADLIIFACGVADAEGFDMGDVVRETWERVQTRDWVASKLDGKVADALGETIRQQGTLFPHHNQD